MFLSIAAPRTRVLLGALTVPLSLALFGCSGSISIGGPDYDALEKDITAELDKAYAPMSRKVDSVKCPRLADDPKKGETFVCTAVLDGNDVRVDVKVEDDEGSVTFTTRDIAFDLAATANSLTTDVAAQVGFPVTVDCGQGLKIVEVGSVFTCTALDEQGESGTIEVTARNEGGSDWRLVE
ncbi:DUF4333 domain-containing protein [Nocardia sp. NPDC058658]|uniref:DUF4333 domain-containing protein n=1 Tax=Nocardia sp. NPDC058658 TaxID=3346580 RepID=UPI00365BDED3